MKQNLVLTESQEHVVLLSLHRPEKLNALNSDMIAELNYLLDKVEADPEIRCIILTGSEKAFAAGVDILEMKNKNFIDSFLEDHVAALGRLAASRKPIIAAVSGPALGGGCELAMMCDIILATENAIFGQPELGLGIMPGGGGTQRLTRAIGKAKAMDMCLTGRAITSREAEMAGLISRLTPSPATLLETAWALGRKIASMPTAAVMMIKESINRTYETPLSEGLLFERRAFQSLFGTNDQKEGMAAFLEKRHPLFRNR